MEIKYGTRSNITVLHFAPPKTKYTFRYSIILMTKEDVPKIQGTIRKVEGINLMPVRTLISLLNLLK